MRVKTEDNQNMGTTLSSEKLAATDLDPNKDPDQRESLYEQKIRQARRDYADVLPPFIHKHIRAGEFREIILAAPDGGYPSYPSSVEIIKARQWGQIRKHCFWTLDHGGNQVILAARCGGLWAGCKYVHWLGKGQGLDGFSERVHAYSMPTARTIALHPEYAVWSTVDSLPAAPPTTISRQALGHDEGVGLEKDADQSRNGHRRIRKLVASDNSSNARNSCQLSSVSKSQHHLNPLTGVAKPSPRPPNALTKGKRPTRNSELPLLPEPIRHQNPTQLYAESSSGSEYEDFARDDTGFDTSSPEPSTPRPTKRPRTIMTQVRGDQARARTGLATPDSMSVARTMSPSGPATFPTSTKSPLPTIGKRSIATVRASGVSSKAGSIASSTSERAPIVHRARNRPRPTIETRSVSRPRTASTSRASRVRSPSREASPEIPLSSPFHTEPLDKEEIVISDTESVVFCGAAEVQGRREVPDSRPASPRIPSSRKTTAEKQELAVSFYARHENPAQLTLK
ncbi:MAG: hypothetical protein Q9169_004843 [Polycauliona sp. 2 TL-2023]